MDQYAALMQVLMKAQQDNQQQQQQQQQGLQNNQLPQSLFIQQMLNTNNSANNNILANDIQNGSTQTQAPKNNMNMVPNSNSAYSFESILNQASSPPIFQTLDAHSQSSSSKNFLHNPGAYTSGNNNNLIANDSQNFNSHNKMNQHNNDHLNINLNNKDFHNLKKNENFNMIMMNHSNNQSENDQQSTRLQDKNLRIGQKTSIMPHRHNSNTSIELNDPLEKFIKLDQNDNQAFLTTNNSRIISIGPNDKNSIKGITGYEESSKDYLLGNSKSKYPSLLNLKLPHNNDLLISNNNLNLPPGIPDISNNMNDLLLNQADSLSLQKENSRKGSFCHINNTNNNNNNNGVDDSQDLIKPNDKGNFLGQNFLNEANLTGTFMESNEYIPNALSLTKSTNIPQEDLTNLVQFNHLFKMQEEFHQKQQHLQQQQHLLRTIQNTQYSNMKNNNNNHSYQYFPQQSQPILSSDQIHFRDYLNSLTNHPGMNTLALNPTNTTGLFSPNSNNYPLNMNLNMNMSLNINPFGGYLLQNHDGIYGQQPQYQPYHQQSGNTGIQVPSYLNNQLLGIGANFDYQSLMNPGFLIEANPLINSPVGVSSSNSAINAFIGNNSQMLTGLRSMNSTQQNQNHHQYSVDSLGNYGRNTIDKLGVNQGSLENLKSNSGNLQLMNMMITEGSDNNTNKIEKLMPLINESSSKLSIMTTNSTKIGECSVENNNAKNQGKVNVMKTNVNSLNGYSPRVLDIKEKPPKPGFSKSNLQQTNSDTTHLKPTNQIQATNSTNSNITNSGYKFRLRKSSTNGQVTLTENTQSSKPSQDNDSEDKQDECSLLDLSITENSKKPIQNLRESKRIKEKMTNTTTTTKNSTKLLSLMDIYADKKNQVKKRQKNKLQLVREQYENARNLGQKNGLKRKKIQNTEYFCKNFKANEQSYSIIRTRSKKRLDNMSLMKIMSNKQADSKSEQECSLILEKKSSLGDINDQKKEESSPNLPNSIEKKNKEKNKGKDKDKDKGKAKDKNEAKDSEKDGDQDMDKNVDKDKDKDADEDKDVNKDVDKDEDKDKDEDDKDKDEDEDKYEDKNKDENYQDQHQHQTNDFILDQITKSDDDAIKVQQPTLNPEIEQNPTNSNEEAPILTNDVANHAKQVINEDSINPLDTNNNPNANITTTITQHENNANDHTNHIENTSNSSAINPNDQPNCVKTEEPLQNSKKLNTRINPNYQAIIPEYRLNEGNNDDDDNHDNHDNSTILNDAITHDHANHDKSTPNNESKHFLKKTRLPRSSLIHHNRRYKEIWNPENISKEELNRYINDLKSIMGSNYMGEEKAISLLKEGNYDGERLLDLLKNDKVFFRRIKIKRLQEVPTPTTATSLTSSTTN